MLKNTFTKKNENYNWDCIIITVRNNKQRAYAKKQLKIRRKIGFIPEETKCIVKTVNKRLGTGKILLNNLYKIFNKKEYKKILYIPSAGNSKRTLYYSRIGKIWIPINKRLSGDIEETIFDQILINTFPILKKMNDGILVSCSDVVLFLKEDINEIDNSKIYFFSTKELIKKGTKHGVFKIQEDRLIKYFQKASKNILEKEALTNEKKVYIDTGMFILPQKILNYLYENIQEKSADIYNDLVPFLVDNKKDDIKVIKLNNGKFVHFGSNKDILEIKSDRDNYFKRLGWNQNTRCLIKDNSYIENSLYIGKLNNNIIVDSCIKQKVPKNTLIYTVKLNRKKWVSIILGIEDDIKYKGKNLKIFNKEIYLKKKIKKETSLWDLKLFKPANSKEKASELAIELYYQIQKGEIINNRKLKSIREILKKGKYCNE